jgi:hypothetical protein
VTNGGKKLLVKRPERKRKAKEADEGVKMQDGMG